MKNLTFLVLALFFGIITQKAKAQQSVVTAQAVAEVIEALTATETSQLNFGKFTPEVQGGQITVSPEGTRSKSGSIILSGAIANSGIFHVTGAPRATFTIQLPSSVALKNQNSEKTMMVNNWISTPQQGSGTGLLANNGEQYIYIGATLQVGDIVANPVGIYTGTYNLTFAYN
jgi:hypothetical protein